MSKVRIHELAKMLDKTNKEILNILKEKNIEVKSHMSTLTEDQITLVRGHYNKQNQTQAKEKSLEIKAEEKKVPEKTTEVKAAEVSAEKTEEPKKRNITQVYRPQNSKSGNWKGRSGNTNNNRPNSGRSQQGRPGQSASNTTNSQSARPRTDVQSQSVRGGEGRPAQQRPAGNTQQRPAGSSQQRPATGQQQRNTAGNQNRPGQDNAQRPSGNNNQQRQSQGSQQRTGSSQPNRSGAQNNQQRPTRQNQQNNRPMNNNQGNQSRINTQAADKGGKTVQGGQKDSGRHGNGHGRSTNSGRPNQGSNRPNQGGGNRPNQRRNVRGRGPQRPQQPAPQKKEEVIKNIVLPEVLTIKELAEKMKVQPSVLVKKLFLQGMMVTVNHEIEYEQAEEIALEFNCIAEPEVKVDVIEELLKEEEEDDAALEPRPPVVCVMGHVDHGKTSLLDAIRNTNVIDREAGGITQHIGAYVVRINGQDITFLDTPGHEAFTAMRMRGASSTDVAILVVAADDGVMPQTVEAINHAKAAGIEIIVAINKIDKPSANIDRVKQELAEYELIPEDWGGSTVFVPVSAKSHEGIEQLLEMILLTSEILELKANPKRKARGLVIEAELDKGKGTVATVLVQKGTLKVGDNIACGSSYGKVRAMMDDKGRRVKTAGPSVPVEILGLNEVPDAGEIFVATESDKEARSFADTYISQGREKLLEDTKAKISLDDLFTHIQAGNVKELGIIVKADVQGSVEAVKQSLLKLSNEEVVVKIIHGGVGAITESDVTLASTSNAIIIGFNVRVDPTAKSVADREKVDLRLYKVIYNAIEDVEAAMKGMLDPVFEEKVLGHAEVRQTFKASGIGTIAGGYILDGLFQRGCSVRLSREEKIIYDGPLASLKRFKDDVKEVKAGFECGLVFEKFNDVKEGDMVEAYTMVEVPR